MSRKSLVPAGIVFEIRLNGLFYYGDYLGIHADYGDVVRVTKTGHAKRLPLDGSCKLAELGEVVIYCTPIKPLLAATPARTLSEMEFTDRPRVPVQWRRMGGFDREGRILPWIIEDKGRDVAIVKRLSKKQKQLPEAALMGTETFFEELSPVPSHEEDDIPTTHNVDPSKGEQEVVAIWHYLYFPKKLDAEKAAREIGTDCGIVNCRRSAQGKEWLVLVESRKASEMEACEQIQERLESVTVKFRGEYDGWEHEFGCAR